MSTLAPVRWRAILAARRCSAVRCSSSHREHVQRDGDLPLPGRRQIRRGDGGQLGSTLHAAQRRRPGGGRPGGTTPRGCAAPTRCARPADHGRSPATPGTPTPGPAGSSTPAAAHRRAARRRCRESVRSVFACRLPTAQRGGVGRLGQMRAHPGRGQLLGDITPPGAPLERQMRLRLPGQMPGQPAGQMRPIRRRDPAPLQLTGVGVDTVEGDLLPMDVQSSYDGHRDLLKLPRAPSAPVRNDHPSELRRPLHRSGTTQLHPPLHVIFAARRPSRRSRNRARRASAGKPPRRCWPRPAAWSGTASLRAGASMPVTRSLDSASSTITRSSRGKQLDPERDVGHRVRSASSVDVAVVTADVDLGRPSRPGCAETMDFVGRPRSPGETSRSAPTSR